MRADDEGEMQRFAADDEPAAAPPAEAEVRRRLAGAALSAWAELLCAVCLTGYAAATWDHPHRGVLLVLAVLLAASAAALWAFPLRRIFAAGGAQLLFLGRSAFAVTGVCVAASVDGGADSVLVTAFFIPLCFATVTYELREQVITTGMVVAGYIVVVLADGGVDVERTSSFAVILAICAWICATQARRDDRQRTLLERVSRADALTGALNRRGFQERAAGELARAARSGTPLSLLVLDLDGLKAVNDTRGHVAGDAVLRDAVAAILATVRPGDATGRLGGDEFAVLLPGTGRPEAREIGDRVREALAGAGAPASVGTAAYPADATTSDALFQHADAELYAAKRGRGRGARQAPNDLSWAAALAHTVDVRMAGRRDHPREVGELAALVGARLGWDEPALERLRLAGLLHDIGKAAIPDVILRKPAHLADAERALVQTHAAIGADMVARIDGLADVAGWIRASHERPDGRGYPAGLSGDAIPVQARVLQVADAYDAMTSERMHRRARGHDETVAELRACAGTQFDPEVVEHLVAALAERRA